MPLLIAEPDLLFCATADELRAWFRGNHAHLEEQWIGYCKVNSGRPSVTWEESVDVALCFGWIDGIRKRVDERSYKVRFTPRRRGSSWSARNVARMEALLRAGLVEPTGLAAFESAKAVTGVRKPLGLPEEYGAKIKQHSAAWRFWCDATPGYRKQAGGWVMSAMREQTQLRRLATLIDCSAQGNPIPPLRWSGRTPAKR